MTERNGNDQPPASPGELSVFEKPWWLEAVAPGRWSEVVVSRGGEPVGRLPYVVKRLGPMRIVTNPPLTPMLGPWLRPIEGKREHRLGREMALLGELVDQLPRVDVVSQSLSPRLTNWLPFHWRGFSGSLRYTYRIEDTSDPDRIWSELRENIRREVRKASRTVEVRDTEDVELFLRSFRRTATRAGWSPRKDEVIRRIHSACSERDANRILLAVDTSERIRACTMIVRDDALVYYLLAGRNDQDAPVGAASLLVWEAIKYATKMGLAFDFEGSMIESIERFFRAFGATQVPYVHVTKSSLRGRALLEARSLLGRNPL